MAKRVGRKRSRGKSGRKPPLRVLSDFGTMGNSPIVKRVGRDHMTKASKKTNYSDK